MTNLDRRDADQLYRAALTVAKAEYDARKHLGTPRERLRQLRTIINNLSGLLALPVDPAYAYWYRGAPPKTEVPAS